MSQSGYEEIQKVLQAHSSLERDSRAVKRFRKRKRERDFVREQQILNRMVKIR